MCPSIDPDQAQRSAAIRRYELGARQHEGKLDGVVELASYITDCPITLISIIHETEQRFEASCGFDGEATSLDLSICSHTIKGDGILEIQDTRLDPRTADNPLVTDRTDPLIYYAGAKIVTPAGVALGTLCVLDRKPRQLDTRQRRALQILADKVMTRLELHDAMRQQDALRREVDHRVKNGLANVAAMTRMAARRAVPEVRAALRDVETRINVMVELHGELYRADDPNAPIDVSSYLMRIASHLEYMTPDGVRIDTRLDPLSLANRRASALGVMVNEMIGNALKHGFPEGRSGRIVLTGRANDRGRYALTCEDDGIGEASGDRGNGLGHKIMNAAAAQLDGFLEVRADATGYRTALEFPLTVP